jgi:uncharacterized protein
MKCPVCSKEMVEEDFNGIKVDFCRDGCKSLWFDWMELPRIDETREGTTESMRAALDAPRVSDANRGPIPCPRCGVKMHPHKYQKSGDVTVDECYACGGFFLDAGELAAIRTTFMDEQHAEAYQKQILQTLPAYKEGVSSLEKEKQRADSLAHLTRFARLSYWFKGK